MGQKPPPAKITKFCALMSYGRQAGTPVTLLYDR